ncbi:MAG: preprotein translocase subunit SecE [Bacilli bacterium]|nr:preprotein translocase subunit SecE [Bacilli bacterium]
MKRLARFFVGVKKELKKVRWPKRKEMVVYSVSTICILVFFMLFFVGIDAVVGTIMKVSK